MNRAGNRVWFLFQALLIYICFQLHISTPLTSRNAVHMLSHLAHLTLLFRPSPKACRLFHSKHFQVLLIILWSDDDRTWCQRRHFRLIIELRSIGFQKECQCSKTMKPRHDSLPSSRELKFFLKGWWEQVLLSLLGPCWCQPDAQQSWAVSTGLAREPQRETWETAFFQEKKKKKLAKSSRCSNSVCFMHSLH